MIPWLTIWVRPRQTIRRIVDTNPRYLVLPLAMGAGGAGGFVQGLLPSWGLGAAGPWSGMGFLLLWLVGGTVAGLAGLYVMGWLYRWVGSWLGGRATTIQVRAALAWAGVPGLASCAFFVLLVGGVRALLGPPDPDAMHPVWQVAWMVGFLALAVIGMWGWVVSCKTLGEVHGFSAWKGLGTQLIPQALLGIPVVFISLVAAIAIPNLLRAQAGAMEATAVQHLARLSRSLQAAHEVRGAYPPSDGWGELAGAGVAVPPEFQVSDGLVGHEVDGYAYSYASPDGTGFTMSAVPERFFPGIRTFYVDATGVVRHCTMVDAGDRATAADRPVDEAPAPCVAGGEWGDDGL